uniref:RING-type E3 ubiquitin transferase n=1 Tax=Chromera velia CCMP2878 TaxID=1169474 RepID=A0A0G4IFM1_9ALVE|eukprot:Cvel_13933.t1-p1 / transcript=Cvel_13933.t1 / gene=Cvel_13933 / organism=Chromera_velia_CCMP2878 / gene_product=Probable E3 ubiquitin-protein ligase DTX2, putative / transcript_product=Probable E3 ubiquitin-protein ligase DTX2, putative / location=Cvel_scaffold972:7864-13406(+) / protein_length=1223 / sequence_SO=supercontig / SO=protein_coding / is_pseudo=false
MTALPQSMNGRAANSGFGRFPTGAYAQQHIEAALSPRRTSQLPHYRPPGVAGAFVGATPPGPPPATQVSVPNLRLLAYRSHIPVSPSTPTSSTTFDPRTVLDAGTLAWNGRPKDLDTGQLTMMVETADASTGQCPVCLDDLSESPETEKEVLQRLGAAGWSRFGAASRLINCSHTLHTYCLWRCVETSPLGFSCPCCKKVQIRGQGKQPPGTMNWVIFKEKVKPIPGYTESPTVFITYNFPGTAAPIPHRPCTAYGWFPLTETEGRPLLRLLKEAFLDGYTFKIGENAIVLWNGISHKTRQIGGGEFGGWPDETYFETVFSQLASKGFMLSDEETRRITVRVPQSSSAGAVCSPSFPSCAKASVALAGGARSSSATGGRRAIDGGGEEAAFKSLSSASASAAPPTAAVTRSDRRVRQRGKSQNDKPRLVLSGPRGQEGVGFSTMETKKKKRRSDDAGALGGASSPSRGLGGGVSRLLESMQASLKAPREDSGLSASPSPTSSSPDSSSSVSVLVSPSPVPSGDVPLSPSRGSADSATPPRLSNEQRPTQTRTPAATVCASSPPAPSSRLLPPRHPNKETKKKKKVAVTLRRQQQQPQQQGRVSKETGGTRTTQKTSLLVEGAVPSKRQTSLSTSSVTVSASRSISSSDTNTKRGGGGGSSTQTSTAAGRRQVVQKQQHQQVSMGGSVAPLIVQLRHTEQEQRARGGPTTNVASSSRESKEGTFIASLAGGGRSLDASSAYSPQTMSLHSVLQPKKNREREAGSRALKGPSPSSGSVLPRQPAENGGRPGREERDEGKSLQLLSGLEPTDPSGKEASAERGSIPDVPTVPVGAGGSKGSKRTKESLQGRPSLSSKQPEKDISREEGGDRQQPECPVDVKIRPEMQTVVPGHSRAVHHHPAFPPRPETARPSAALRLVPSQLGTPMQQQQQQPPHGAFGTNGPRPSALSVLPPRPFPHQPAASVQLPPPQQTAAVWAAVPDSQSVFHPGAGLFGQQGVTRTQQQHHLHMQSDLRPSVSSGFSSHFVFSVPPPGTAQNHVSIGSTSESSQRGAAVPASSSHWRHAVAQSPPEGASPQPYVQRSGIRPLVRGATGRPVALPAAAVDPCGVPPRQQQPPSAYSQKSGILPQQCNGGFPAATSSFNAVESHPSASAVREGGVNGSSVVVGQVQRGLGVGGWVECSQQHHVMVSKSHRRVQSLGGGPSLGSGGIPGAAATSPSLFAYQMP